MATKDSQELKSDERYPLGDYSFRIERSSGTSPNYDKIEAICTKGGKNARKSVQIASSTKINGWYVEANETEASVYALLGIVDGHETSSDFEDLQPYVPFEFGSAVTAVWGNRDQPMTVTAAPFSAIVALQSSDGAYNTTMVQASSSPPPSAYYTFTYDNRTVYYYTPSYSLSLRNTYPVIRASGNGTFMAHVAWTMIYGKISGDETPKEIMVGRFAIDTEDAGGEGPGSDWEDPGDYDEDWEEGDPTYTLYVTVTGALSGRHNDPIEDPSYSYIPADKDTVKDYGCGGDGGHGGGGGAGASTVVVHKFATNQANSKEVIAIARRHGYGSGGGKGGKGGDGCILVYY